MAASEYGLSIALDFKDNASAGLQSAANSFSSLSGSADSLTMGIGSTANSLLDMNTSVVGMSVLGSQLQNMGQSMIGSLADVGSKVMETGSTFENFKITLDAMYGSADKATGVVNDLFKFAVKSPFEVGDLQNMVVTLKSQGIEAFGQMTRASDGFTQSTMDWIGDLQAFRPGVAASRWKLAIQNYLSGTDTMSSRVLRNILDVGDLATFIGHDLGTNVEDRMQSLMEIIDKTNMTGMQSKLSATWSVTLSNMSDAWSQFAYRIGFGNQSANMYQSATKAAQNLLSAETSIFTNDNVINAMGDAFNGLVSPIEKVTEIVAGLAPAFSEWLGMHPKVVSFATGITAVGGAALVAGGSILKLSAGVLNWMLNVQRLGGVAGVFNILGTSVKALSLRMMGIGSVATLAYLAWKNNALGIQDLFKSISKQASSLFSNVNKNITENGMSLKQALNTEGLTKFTEGVDRLKQAAGAMGNMVYEGFSSVFSLFGVDLPKFTDETFNLKDALNNFGDSLSDKFGNIDEIKEKYGELFKVVGAVGGSFLTAFASSTVLAGGMKLLSGSFSMMLSNTKMILSTLVSPMGLLGVGIAALVAGYQYDFLGLQSTVSPVVDKIKGKLKELKESFSQKDENGNNSILSAISSSAKKAYGDLKTWRSDTGASVGQALGQGISAGLITFGNPIQKAIGLGMFALSNNLGGVQDDAYHIVDTIIQVKDLMLEMSTGYGPKAHALADQFGLQKFAQGMVDIKDTAKGVASSILNGFTEGNGVISKMVKTLFPDMDFSLKGLLNGFGTIGTKLKDSFDNGILGKASNMLGKVASAASTTAGTFAVFGGIASMALGPIISNAPAIMSLLTGALTNPFVLGTAAVLAYQTNFGGLKDKVDGFINREKTAIGLAKTHKGEDFTTRFNEDGSESLVNIKAVNAALEVWDNKQKVLSGFWTGIKDGAKAAGKSVESLVSSFLNLDTEKGSTLIEKIGNKILGVGGLDGVISGFAKLGFNIGEVATKSAILLPFIGALSAASKALGIDLSSVSTGMKLIKGGANLVASGAKTIFNSVLAGTKNVFSAMTSLFPHTLDILKNILSAQLLGGNGLFGGSSLVNAFNRIRGTIQNAIQGIGNMATNYIQRLGHDVWNNFASALANGASAAPGQILGTFMNTIRATLGGAVDGFAGIGTEAFGNLVQSLRGLAAPLSGVLSGIASFQLSFGAIIDAARISGQIFASIQIAKWQMQLDMLKSITTAYGSAIVGAGKMVIGLTGMTMGFGLLAAAALTFGTLVTSDWNDLSERINGQQTLIGKLGTAYDWFNEKLAGTTERFTNFMEGFNVEGFVAKLGNVGGRLLESLSSIVGGTDGKSGLADLGGQMAMQITSGLATATASGGRIASAMQNIFTAVSNSIQTYAPSIGKNIGDIFGNIMEFAGKNSKSFFDSAFTLIQSFVEGLAANKDKIVDGAMQILDSFIQSFSSHSGKIMEAAGTLVDGLISGLESRAGTIGLTAIDFLSPLFDGIESGSSRLWNVGQTVFTFLWQKIKEVTLKGAADVLQVMADFVGRVSGAIAGIGVLIGLMGAALMFVPGMELIGAQLVGMGVGMEVAAAGGGLLSHELSSISKDFMGMSISAGIANNKLLETADQVKYLQQSAANGSVYKVSADGTQLEEVTVNAENLNELSQAGSTYQLWATDDGSLELMTGHIEQIKDEETGEVHFQFVADEGSSPQKVYDSAKGEIEANPIIIPVEYGKPTNKPEYTSENPMFGSPDQTVITSSEGSTNEILPPLGGRFNGGSGASLTGSIKYTPTIDPPLGVESTEAKGEIKYTPKIDPAITDAQKKTTGEIKYKPKIDNIDNAKKEIKGKINYGVGNTPTTADIRELNSKVNYTGNFGEVGDAPEKTSKVNYGLGSQVSPKDKNAKVNYLLGSQASPKSPMTATVNYILGSQADPIGKTATVTYTLSGSVPKPNWGIDENAGGTNNFGGGLTWINEKGPELVNLPSGTQIIPHDESLAQRYTSGYEDGMKDGSPKLTAMTQVSPSYIVSPNATANNVPKSYNYDNSVKFGQGSIVVNVDNSNGDRDYESAAEKIMYYINKKQQRQTIARR